MFNSIQFTFNGISSEDMGVHIVSESSSLFEEIFLPRRTIIETQATGKRKPYFQRVVNEPLSFPLTFFIYEWQERDNLRQIARWLFQDYYKPLWFDTNPERIFYAIIEGDSSLFHNGLQQGYITLYIRCDSPYSYSPVVESKGIVKSTSIYNEGDLSIKPKVRLTKTVSNGDISIINHSTNQTLVLSNLQNDEEVFIDCENEEIISSLQYLNIYRYDDHNDVWIDLVANDSNSLELIGDFVMDIEYEMIYLAG